LTRRRLQPTRRGDDGFGTVEMVLLTPVLVLLLLLVVGVGRVEQARLQVTGAARDAARAASLSRTADAAASQAQASADVALAGQSVTCVGGPVVSVDTSQFVPGGQVVVTVTCPARLGDLGFPGLPATKTLTATAASPLEQYRAGP
jgi:Flp pilus assembly protein TadG